MEEYRNYLVDHRQKKPVMHQVRKEFARLVIDAANQFAQQKLIADLNPEVVEAVSTILHDVQTLINADASYGEVNDEMRAEKEKAVSKKPIPRQRATLANKATKR